MISTTGSTTEQVPFDGRKFPTYFRIAKEPRGGLAKSCPLNRTVRIEFETDAANDYFDRTDCPGSISFEPPNLCVSSHLWDGRFTAKFQMPYDAAVGDVVNMTVSVTDIQRDIVGPFTSNFTMLGTSETNDVTKPSGPVGPRPRPHSNGKQLAAQLAAPDIREVRRDKWQDPHFKFTEYSAVKIVSADENGSGYIFFINMDNRFLINELHKTKEQEGALVRHWFKYGIVLSALGIIKELERLKAEANTSDSADTEPLEMSKISTFCGGIARVVVPMIRALHKGPAIVQSAAVSASS